MDGSDRCDRCLGRRLIGAQGEAPQREAAATYRAENGIDETAASDCVVCEDRWPTDAWLAAALEAIAPYEAAEFQVGTMFPESCEHVEKAWKPVEEVGDTIRTEANRILGSAIAEATGMTWRTDGRPELVVTVDTRFHSATARANSLFVAGRYTKSSRELPQTHWPCKRCQGTGCWECDDAGHLYASSVEQVVGDACLPAFDATGYSFHGAGREDIDALMLGTGRPFVLELHDPKRRTVDFSPIESALAASAGSTGACATGLRITEKEEVARIKGADYQKEYLAHCLTEESVTAEQVAAAAEAMTGVTLQQRTPQRVAHRRADKVRERQVERIAVETSPDGAGTRFSIRVLAESGAYIKEMVSSDEGRTEPSFAAALGVPTTVEFLDVMAILDDA